MILTIAGVAATAAIVNAVLPALSRSSGAVTSASAKVDDRLMSDVEIVHVVGELDSNGAFADTNSNGKFDIFLWVKNVGSTRINTISESDLFLGKTGSFARIPHETEVQSTVFPRWGHIVEDEADNSELGPKDTLKVTVTYDSTQSTGNYDVKFTIPNGVSDDDFFSL